MTFRGIFARFLLMFLLGSAFIFSKDWKRYWNTPLTQTGSVSIPDNYSAQIYDRPFMQKLFPGDYYLPLRLLVSGQRFHSGQYSLSDVHTRKDLYHKMVRHQSDYYRFRIHDGWSWKQLKKALNKAPSLQRDLRTVAQQSALIERAHAESLEGIFAPDTYFYTPNMPQSELLWMAHRQQKKILKKLSCSSPHLKTDNDILTLASIIQKEGMDLESFKKVSGVFHNRLNKKMRLQSDATVVYLIGSPVKKVSRRDLWIEGAHNTYRHDGLPPFAIAYPSKNAIIAAVYPEPSEYLFFLTDKHGRFIFSKDFKEHVGTKKYM